MADEDVVYIVLLDGRSGIEAVYRDSELAGRHAAAVGGYVDIEHVTTEAPSWVTDYHDAGGIPDDAHDEP